MSTRIKVLYLINSLAQGGAERQMAETVRRLPRDRFTPVLVSLSKENAYAHLLPADQPQYQLDGGMTLTALRQFNELLAKERPQIVHSFMERANLFNRLIAPRHGNPVVISSVRSRMMALRYSAVEGLLARRAQRVVVNSVGTKQELMRIQRVQGERIEVVYNIIDFERFSPLDAAERREKRRDLGLRGTTVLVPGRISFAKHQLGLFWALGQLRRLGRLHDDARFLLAGRVFNPIVQTLCDRISQRFGLHNHVRYLGPRRDITELYGAADWVMLPSLWEGLPNAAIEGHACARPLLLSADANMDQIMLDGVTGYQFDTLLIPPLMGAIETALSTPGERAREMGLAGQARVRERFNPERVLASLTDLYERLLVERAGHQN